MSILFEKSTLCGGDLILSKEKVDPQKALDLSLIITEIAIRALTAFLEGDFAVFDAPVGDNSCKIRAVKIALIAQQDNKKEITNLLPGLINIQKRIKHIQNEKWNSSLKEFRLKEGIEFPVSWDLAFLIQSHFLFLVKAQGTYERTEPALLQQIAPITNSDAKNWIHKVKEKLAASSVCFVQKEAEKMESKRKVIVQKMLKHRFIKMHEKRPILSNAYSMEVLFMAALKNDLSIVFKSPDETLLFHPNANKTAFIPKEAEDRDFDRAAVVIEGKIFKHLPFDKSDFFRLLLAKAIQDPQYLDGKNSEVIPFEKCMDDLEIQEERKRFDEWNKISVPFQIDHILCDKIKNLFSRQLFLHKEEQLEQLWHSCNWMGDDLNIRPGSSSPRLKSREVCY